MRTSKLFVQEDSFDCSLAHHLHSWHLIGELANVSCFSACRSFIYSPPPSFLGTQCALIFAAHYPPFFARISDIFDRLIIIRPHSSVRVIASFSFIRLLDTIYLRFIFAFLAARAFDLRFSPSFSSLLLPFLPISSLLSYPTWKNRLCSLARAPVHFATTNFSCLLDSDLFVWFEEVCPILRLIGLVIYILWKIKYTF